VAHVQNSRIVSIQGLSLIARSSRSWPDQTHIRSPFARPHQYPACGGRAEEDDTILYFGFLGHVGVRFVHLDPPELIKSWKI
jgi:hypothetical protein